MLRGENASPKVCGTFYRAIVQSVLLYGSESWVIRPALLERLEGFHVCAAWRMARVNKPQRGANRVWSYPPTADVLEEVGLRTMEEYIRRRRNTIAEYIATRCPVMWTCWEGERIPGAPRHTVWWEQEFDSDLGTLVAAAVAADEAGSDDPTASEASWESWEEGSGG